MNKKLCNVTTFNLENRLYDTVTEEEKYKAYEPQKISNSMGSN